MVKSVYTADSKSAAATREGSSPFEPRAHFVYYTNTPLSGERGCVTNSISLHQVGPLGVPFRVGNDGTIRNHGNNHENGRRYGNDYEGALGRCFEEVVEGHDGSANAPPGSPPIRKHASALFVGSKTSEPIVGVYVHVQSFLFWP